MNLTSRCRAMPRLLIAAAVLLTGPAHAQIDPKIKAECMKARDFVGCIKVLSVGIDNNGIESFKELRGAMLKVAARLEAGISLNNFATQTQPLIDELALAKARSPDTELVKAAAKASDMLSVFQASVQARIDSGQPTVFNNKTRYSCKTLIHGITLFNKIAGDQAATAGCKNNWLDVATEEDASNNEISMLRFISAFLRDSAETKILQEPLKQQVLPSK